MRRVILVLAVAIAACTQKAETVSNPKTAFSNMDSLVDAQLNLLKKSKPELHKLVEKDGKTEEVKFVPDSAEWANELNMFRQLDMVNKASFRDAYVVTDARDTNSNLKVREVKASRPVPVSSIRYYYLNDLKDLRRIEASWSEENAIYDNTRRLTMEFGKSGGSKVLQRYRIEGSQKMSLSDSIHFVISGEVQL